MTAHEQVRLWRKAKRLSQHELAVRAGMERAHIARLERGKHAPSLPTLERVAGALGVDVAALLRQTPNVPFERRVHEYLTKALNIAPYGESDADKVARVHKGLMRILYQRRR